MSIPPWNKMLKELRLTRFWNSLQANEFTWEDILKQYYSLCAGLLWALGARMMLSWYEQNCSSCLCVGINWFAIAGIDVIFV
jgi:hypothetical protein